MKEIDTYPIVLKHYDVVNAKNYFQGMRELQQIKSSNHPIEMDQYGQSCKRGLTFKENTQARIAFPELCMVDLASSSGIVYKAGVEPRMKILSQAAQLTQSIWQTKKPSFLQVDYDAIDAQEFNPYTTNPKVLFLESLGGDTPENRELFGELEELLKTQFPKNAQSGNFMKKFAQPYCWEKRETNQLQFLEFYTVKNNIIKGNNLDTWTNFLVKK